MAMMLQTTRGVERLNKVRKKKVMMPMNLKVIYQKQVFSETDYLKQYFFSHKLLFGFQVGMKFQGFMGIHFLKGSFI